jgi:L,D-transpeptidase-like protein
VGVPEWQDGLQCGSDDGAAGVIYPAWHLLCLLETASDHVLFALAVWLALLVSAHLHQLRPGVAGRRVLPARFLVAHRVGPGTIGWHYDPKYGWQWGTHGYVAMPYSAAQWLYNWAPIGTTVVIEP